MEIEELATEVKGLSESITALLAVMTPLAESLKPEVKPDVDVAAAAVEADRKAEESEIPVELRTAILEAAKTGGDVDAAIASAKTVVDAVKSRLTESHESEGRFGGAGTVEDAAAYVPKGF